MKKISAQFLSIAIAVLIAGHAYASNTGTVAIKSASSINNVESPGNQGTLHKTVEVNGLIIFYREAGPKNAPTLLLLHGYPTSSHMFRNLIKDLSGSYHLLAPDYPGYGRSEQPPMANFDYTFDNMSNIVEGFLKALNVEKFSIYLMDYGAPIGYRIAAKYPERVDVDRPKWRRLRGRPHEILGSYQKVLE